MKVVSSPSGSYWYIVHKGIVVISARKRGHGSATKAQMIEWATELRGES